METSGSFEWEAVESSNPPLLDLTIKNVTTGKSLKISEVVWATGDEGFLSEVYNTAVETLEGAEHCCYEGKVSWVDE